jgi:cation diffusion facilitator family transporter
MILKLAAGILCASLSMIAGALHSAMDLVASIIAIKVSSQVPSKKRTHSDGKTENLYGILQGMIFFVAAAFIIKEALHRIKLPTELYFIWIAIGVMLLSTIINGFISSKMYQKAREDGSIALETNALNLKIDAYTSLGVAVGLLLANSTGISIFDPIFGWLIALVIIREAWILSASAFHPLLDSSLSPQEKKKINLVLEKHKAHVIDYHKLKAWKSENIRYLDFYITINEDITIKVAKQRLPIITSELEQSLENTRIIIHI